MTDRRTGFRTRSGRVTLAALVIAGAGVAFVTQTAGATGEGAKIGDRVWNDTNRNGVQDAGEPGVGGVRVTVLNSAGRPIGTRTTGSGGFWGINVKAGTYSVSIDTSTLPTTCQTITTRDAGNDAADSDADPSSGRTGTYVITDTQNNQTIDIGCYGGGGPSPSTTTTTPIPTTTTPKTTTTAAPTTTTPKTTTTTTPKTTTTVDPCVNKCTIRVQGDTTITEDDNTRRSYRVVSDRPAPVDFSVCVRVNNGSAQQTGNDAKGQIRSEPIAYQQLTFFIRRTVAGWGPNPDVNSWWNQDYSVWANGSVTQPGQCIQANFRQGQTQSDVNIEVIAYRETTKWHDTWVVANITSGPEVKRPLSVFNEREEDFTFRIDSPSKPNCVNLQDTRVVIRDNPLLVAFKVTPIAIDLDGSGAIETTRRPVNFDMDNNGRADRTNWISPNDGFLAIDTNNNGRIDNQAELFGGPNLGDGFAELATHDTNNDGLITPADAGYTKLRIWQDANHNGITDSGELRTLTSTGVTAINTAWVSLPTTDSNGNEHNEHSLAHTTAGPRLLVDVWLAGR